MAQPASRDVPVISLSNAAGLRKKLAAFHHNNSKQIIMNAELVKLALEKVANPHLLINIISQRVRQLGYNNGVISRPMVTEVANQGLADVALREVIEEKLGWTIPEIVPLTRPTGKKRPARPTSLKSGSLGNRSAVASGERF